MINRVDNSISLKWPVAVSLAIHLCLLFILPTPVMEHIGIQPPAQQSSLSVRVMPAQKSQPDPQSQKITDREEEPELTKHPAEPDVTEQTPVEVAQPDKQEQPAPERPAEPEPSKVVKKTKLPKPAPDETPQATDTPDKPPQHSEPESQQETAEANAVSAESIEQTDTAQSKADYLDYVADIRNRIEKNTRYPLMAKRRSIKGQTTVQVVLSKDGSLLTSTIVKSSGSASLDKASLKAIRLSVPFPAFPDSLQKKAIKLNLPISFQ